jgi:DNA-binding HxlR family transcriptional regulator
MQTYGQYCPIARAAEILGDRWTLLILRELLTGATGFNEIERGLPRISRALLAQRLRQMQSTGLVTHAAKDGAPGGARAPYGLTSAGRALMPLIFGLAEWSARWAFGDPRPEELNGQLLLWWIRGRIDRSVLPSRRIVVRFDFADDRNWYWLLLEPDDVSLCLTSPGCDVDVFFRTDLTTLYSVWLGRRELSDAISRRQLQLDGDPRLARVVTRAIAPLSPVAYAVRAAAAEQRTRADDAPAAAHS